MTIKKAQQLLTPSLSDVVWSERYLFEPKELEDQNLQRDVYVISAHKWSGAEIDAMTHRFFGFESTWLSGLGANNVDAFIDTHQVLLRRTAGSLRLMSPRPKMSKIIVGPPGTGKSSLALILALNKRHSRTGKNTKIVKMAANNLIGSSDTQASEVITGLTKVEADVLIIEDVDLLVSPVEQEHLSFVRSRLANTIKSQIKDGVGVIITGLPDQVEFFNREHAVLNNMLFSTIELKPFDEGRTLLVFQAMLARMRLTIEDSALEIANTNLQKARTGWGDQFQNGKTIEEFFYEMLRLHAARFTEDEFKDIKNGDVPPDDFAVIRDDAIPLVSSDYKLFRPNRASLRVVSVAPPRP